MVFLLAEDIKRLLFYDNRKEGTQSVPQLTRIPDMESFSLSG